MDSYQGQVLSIWKLFTIAGKQRDLGIFICTYEVLSFLVPDKKKMYILSSENHRITCESEPT